MEALEPEPAPAAESEGQKYVLEDQIGFRLRKAHQRASEIFNAVMGGFDVTPTQFAALAKLDDVGPVPQNHLGRLVAMDPATIFGVVGRLTKRGYVRQAVDGKDARVVLVALTDEGRATVVRMKAVAAEVSRKTLAPLSAREAETLLRLIAKLG
ncbi:MAG TPA: MarR family transcriptional regulator [Beijerinckiaceae bacterium]|jgi:DNA-binding MarR family transcriptional regulator